jgi:hypothetical protein
MDVFLGAFLAQMQFFEVVVTYHFCDVQGGLLGTFLALHHRSSASSADA